MKVVKEIVDALARTQLARLVLRGFGKEPRPAAPGHVIYHHGKKCIEFWDGTKWVELPGSGGGTGGYPPRWTVFMNERLKDYPAIDPITGASSLNNTITLAGNQTAKYPVGQTIHIVNSKGNDGWYIVLTAVFAAGSTTITMRALTQGGNTDPAIGDDTADGFAYADFGGWDLIWSCGGYTGLTIQSLVGGGLRFTVPPGANPIPIRDISFFFDVGGASLETVFRMGSDPQGGDDPDWWGHNTADKDGNGHDFYVYGDGSVSFHGISWNPGTVPMLPGSLYTMREEMLNDGTQSSGGKPTILWRGTIWIDGALVFDTNWLGATAGNFNGACVYAFQSYRSTNNQDSDTVDLLRATLVDGCLEPLSNLALTEPIPTGAGI